MSRPYFAMIGPEIIEIVTNEVKRALENSGEFKLARTFPQISWKWKLEMEVYPSEPKEILIETSGTDQRSEPKLPAEHYEFEGGKDGIGKTLAPDQVRVDEGLKLTKPVFKKGMGTVDELMDSLDGH